MKSRQKLGMDARMRGMRVQVVILSLYAGFIILGDAETCLRAGYNTTVTQIIICSNPFKNEGQAAVLDCPVGSFINLTYVNFGRTRPYSEVCDFSAGTSRTDCTPIPAVTQLASVICQGQQSCQLTYDGLNLWDTCPNTYKYFDVRYTCIQQVGFIIHHLTTSPLPCKGVLDTAVDSSILDSLEDTSYDTCIEPLSDGSNMAKITMEIFNHTATMLHVVTAITKEASCNPPGVVLAVETIQRNLIECILVDDDNSNANFRACRYTCLCNSCCVFVHIHFYNLEALSLQNIELQLCDVQVCFP